MAKQIEFTAKNVKAFTSWLKIFSLIDNSLLLEIDNDSKEFIAKSYNEERSVVKFSKIKFDEAGFVLKKSKDSQRIKVGIYNISNIIKVFEHFGEDEFSVTFKYEEVLSDTDKDYAGTSILLKNDSLKVGIECTSLNIFKYIGDDVFLNKIASIDPTVQFDFAKENISKINSLCDLNKDYKFMQFLNKDGKLFAKSKAFELLLSVGSKTDISIDILKSQFTKLDIEDYNVKLGEDRLVFSSNDSNTITVISMVEQDERYEETPNDDII